MLFNQMPIVMEQQQGGLMGTLTMLLPLALMFVVMYFLMIRPQRNKEKKLREQISQMRVGDNVMTIGGIVGRVASLTDDEVTLYTSVANTMMTFKKTAVSQILTPQVDTPEQS